MDDNGTKVLPKKQPPLPPNCILPTEIDNDVAHSEGGPESEVPLVNEIQETQRSDLAPSVEETFPPNQPSSDKTIEGYAETKDREYCYIVLYQQQLSVYEGDSKESELLHQYAFPHGAEYRFSGSSLYIYDENGQEIELYIEDQQLFNEIYMEWVITRLFSDFKREKAQENAKDEFCEKNYSLIFNLPSFREFGNVYNEDYMTLFQFYPIADGKPQIKNAAEFQHFFRPNRLMESNQQEYGEDDEKYETFRSREIEEYMTNRDRKFIQWAPSRDWSRLFVLSTIPRNKDCDNVYLEFYNFNKEKQSILFSQKRINFLSQLLRPKWIKFVEFIYKSEASQVQIETSFTADTIFIRHEKTEFIIIYLNPDWTYKEQIYFGIDNTSIESFTLSYQNFYVKSNEFYYEQSVKQIKDYQEEYTNLSFDKDFIKNTTLKNIIKSGIYDILIFDQHVKIFSNTNPLNLLKDIIVDNDMLKLLQSNNIIQIDYNQIACLSQPINDKAIPIIITIYQDKLVMKDRRQSGEITLKSPWNTKPSDCQFNLVKFKEHKYAVLIVSSASKIEQFYSYYGFNHPNYILAYSKPLNDYKNLQQIPHLPLVNINGSQFINCDHYFNNYPLELDLIQDEQEILNYDHENINSQLVEVYLPNFKKYLFWFIEEKENIIVQQTQSEMDFRSIEIPELRTSIIIKSGGQNSGVIIFQPSVDKIKHLQMKQAIRYRTHNLIYRDRSYYVSIILQIENALYEMRMCFDNLAGVTLAPIKLIMNLTEEQNQHEIYLNDDFTGSLFISGPDCCFKHFSLNSQDEQEEHIKIDFNDEKSQNIIPQLTLFIQRIAHSKSSSIGKLFLQNFKSIIFKNAEGFIKEDLTVIVFAFQNKIIFFEKGVNNLTILDNSFTVIGSVILPKFPPSIIRIASSIDSEAIEYIDEVNSKFPIPILVNLQDSKTYNNRLHSYGKYIDYPLPIQFGLLDGFIAHLNLKSEKLHFFNSNQDKKDGNIAARIEIIARSESFIDEIFNSKERRDIEERMKKIEINNLLSYNVNKRINLITATKDHEEKDHIYNVLYKLLEIADIKELPMLIYNTSLHYNKYESILDVLIENKAIKLALLIVNIAMKQDQIGYIYSRLYQYLSHFSANELQMFFENQIFFFKIPEDCYEEYQIVKDTLKRPFSDYKTFFEIQKNMAKVESKIKPIEKDQGRTEKKDSDYPAEDKEGDQLKKSGRNLEDNDGTVPTEYFAINLMNLIQSNNQSLIENHEDHREVTRKLIYIDQIDETIIEKESFQIIIDFKWYSYARMFFILQLGLFTCFIIAFIFDVVAVSKNQHIFSNDDSNQINARIISIAILIPFAIYEIANIVITQKQYFESFWNINDLLLIAFYAAYFTTAFARPEQKDFLKILQLLIVIFTFLKFSFLIRIWPQISFLVKMLIVVIKQLIIFLVYFLLVIGVFTVMAIIIMVEYGDGYSGIKSVAYFVIMLRQAVGDSDTSTIIDGSKEFQIYAWFLWLFILIIGNIVFMNFIIAVVSDSYDFCMERKTQLINRAKLEMIQECEDILPDWFFSKRDYFPRFIIIRREQGSCEAEDNSDEWNGFVKQMQKHLQHETNKLNDIFIQNINRSTESTKKEMKTGQEEAKKETAEVKTGQEVMKKDVAEVKQDVAEVKNGQEAMKKDVAEVKIQINQINLILSTVFKDQIAIIKAKQAQPNDNKAI